MNNFDEITGRIKELAENPSAISSHIQNQITGMDESLPNVSQAISNHVVRSVQYLNEKVPRPSGILPLTTKWEASDPQKQSFEQHYLTVNDPTMVLKKIANGELTSDHMEALQAVHPDLLQEMQNKVRQQIDGPTAVNMPNHVKRCLSMFMGMPLENLDAPIVKMKNQMVFGAQAAQKQAQMQSIGTGKTTQKGLSEISISKRSATSTQKLESKDE